jgi:hypothetical protein
MTDICPRASMRQNASEISIVFADKCIYFVAHYNFDPLAIKRNNTEILEKEKNKG